MDEQESLFATPKRNMFEPEPLTAYEKQKRIRQMTHANDTDTSKISAQRVFEKMQGLGKQVLIELAAVAPAGYTAEELATKMGIESTVSGNKVAKALSMLLKEGLVKRSGIKRRNTSGNLAMEYVLA